ncbi:DUF309 domain-containing protein [Chengkuizengella sediminis]|uniref:DUF309 domain-containing protein n=1 Tax=Chengkuizengella sediminis TaxID=1885917 RepID=UPI001389B7E0|nr:DUF309 domain-containing protein [Chengkuizengella sediminis]NDI34498.1 DUF309 domain-containing protein [Chengkuizengella sediminis]
MIQQKQYPQEYIDYLIYFHAERDYFECHEILEEYWKEKERPELDEAWVGLIQVAVSLYHQRRNNINGAVKMMRSAITNLNAKDLHILGINAEAFINQLEERLKELTSTKLINYSDLNIPLKDDKLMERCKQICKEENLSWQSPSDLLHKELIHKHTLRDRTEVIKTREWAKTQKLKDDKKE